MADLTLNLFGPFKATLNGEPLDQFRTIKVQALLIFLVVESGVAQRREALMELLWPGLSLKSAQVNLRQTLFRLRKMISELTTVDGEQKAPFLLSNRLTIRVNPNVAFEVYTGRFDSLIGRSRVHDHLNLVSCTECREHLRLAVDLYGGSFLADFYLTDSNEFEDWAAAKREAYRRQALDALETLTVMELQRGAFVEAQAFARQQIAIDRLDERAYRRLFEALAHNGRRHEALAEYDKLRELLAEELGIEPSEETRQLHSRLLSGEQLPAIAVKEVEQTAVLDLSQFGDAPAEPPAFLTDEEDEKDRQGVFVGRERELSRLHGFLDKSLTGRGSVAFVMGEAGRGKTSLLNEFARRAQATHPDLVVASGTCNAYSGVGDAYLPFRDVMAMLTGDVEMLWLAGLITRDHALRLWRLLPATAGAIVEQAPELLDTFVSPEALASWLATFSSSEGSKLDLLQERLARLTHTGRHSEDQSQLFGAYTEVLSTLAGQHPFVLILDDLHWADVSSINLLFHLARRVGESRILILGAYRPEDVFLGRDGQEHPLKGVLGEFKSHFGDIWVDIDQEEPADSRDFVDALLDSEPNRLGEYFRQELAHHTQGHPLFTVELLRDMQERGDLVQDEMGYWNESPDLGWDAFPAKVEGVIEKRIDRLDIDLREVLTVASVEGESFTAEVIARVLRVEEQALMRQLSGQLDKQHRLVRATGIERLGAKRLSHYRFRHSLFQRYLYTSLDEIERAYRHEAVGDELEELYASQPEELEAVAGQLARHFHEAGDKERALKYYMLAGDRAIRLFAHEEAIQYLQTALDLLETGERVETQLGLLEKLAGVTGPMKDIQALSYYQTALKLWSSLASADKMIAVRLHRKILETAFQLHWNVEEEALVAWSQTLAASRAYLEARLPLAQSEHPKLEWVRVLTTLAKITDMGFPSPEDLETAEGYARAAVDLAKQLDAPEELSDALEALGRIYFVLGRLPDQLEVSRRRLALSRDPRFGDPRKRIGILLSFTDALMVVGEYAQAMQQLLESERLAIQIRDVAGRVWALGLQALCMFRLDRWDELFKLEEKRRELEQRYSRDQLGGGNCVVLSLCAAAHALQGDLDQARFLREQAFAIMARDSNWGRTQYY